MEFMLTFLAAVPAVQLYLLSAGLTLRGLPVSGIPSTLISFFDGLLMGGR